MYQCINIPTHLHTVYLNMLQAVLEQFEVRLKIRIERAEIYTPRL